MMDGYWRAIKYLSSESKGFYMSESHSVSLLPSDISPTMDLNIRNVAEHPKCCD